MEGFEFHRFLPHGGRPQPTGERSRERERDRVIHVAKDLKRANLDTRHVVLNSRHAPPVDESLKVMEQ